MRNKILLAGLLASVLPGAALAQPDPNCVRSNHDSRIEGTVLGAVGGAVLGGVLGRGTGAAIGGLGGAVAGNAIAGSRNQPCPSGYYYAPPPQNGGPPSPPPPGYDRERARDDRGPGYGPTAYGPPPQGPAFWNDAPGDVRQRIDFMQDRLQHAADEGQLNPRQLRQANTELRSIRGSARSLARRDNGLTEDDRTYIQARLDHLGERLHWMERTGY